MSAVADPTPPAIPNSAGTPASLLLEVWVDLSVPELASLSRDRVEERRALRERIVRQQDTVMKRLAVLGAVEQGRVQHVRNALAVRLPAAALVEAQRIPGVRGIRAVRHRHKPSQD